MHSSIETIEAPPANSEKSLFACRVRASVID